MASLLTTLKTITPYHLALYSIVFGATTYQSFFAGIVSFRVLTREQFGTLQSNIFPYYFPAQAIASGLLLALPAFKLSSTGKYALGVALATSTLNALYLGPINTRLIRARNAQAASENLTDPRDPAASETLKNINAEFGKVHGFSVLSNMATFGSLALYGLVIASHIV